MAYVNITNLSGWQYDNSPPDPGVGHPHRPLWLKSSNGIRQFKNGTEVYVKTKKTTDANTVNRGEISKTFWDAHP